MYSKIADEKARWDKRAGVYQDGSKGVFNLTKYPFVINRVLERIMPGRVLDLGCGPTARMLLALEQAGNIAEGVDCSQKMLDETRKNGWSGNLYCEDTRVLWAVPSEHYSSVVSLNSILPPERKDASVMLGTMYRVLDWGGVFVGIVMSYEYHLRLEKEIPDIRIDHATERLWDEEGWQCAFSRETMTRELIALGFESVVMEPLVFNDPQVFDDIEALYGVRLPPHLALEEWLVVATK